MPTTPAALCVVSVCAQTACWHDSRHTSTGRNLSAGVCTPCAAERAQMLACCTPLLRHSLLRAAALDVVLHHLVKAGSPQTQACLQAAAQLSARNCLRAAHRCGDTHCWVLLLSIWFRQLHRFVCLFVCFIDKTQTVKPLGRFHSRILSFTQDGPAFSTKTTQRALQVAKVGNLQVDELARLSRSTEHVDLTRDAPPYTNTGLPSTIMKLVISH